MSAGGKNAVMTVEAALVCPILVFIICAMIGKTLDLYEKVKERSAFYEEGAKELPSPADMLYLYAIVGDLTELLTEDGQED